MRLLDALLDAAIRNLPVDLREGVVVFGSAPMVFAGLKPDVANDLDLFVSEETFRGLVGAGRVPVDPGSGVPRIALAEKVDVFDTWPGVDFREAYAASATRAGSRGLRVASLDHVLASKLASDRAKDRTDIEILRRALSR
jgi:hypothetical protein